MPSAPGRRDVPEPFAKGCGAPDMSIPGIAAIFPSPARAPGAGIGIVMPGMAAGGCSGAAVSAGTDGDACGLDISIPGIVMGIGEPGGGEVGVGGPISIPGIEGGADGAGDGAPIVIPGMESLLAGFGLDARAALRRLDVCAGARFLAALALVFGLVAGLAGIFMPGIDMPPTFWAAAMPGSIATAAAATSHLVLIIEKISVE